MALYKFILNALPIVLPQPQNKPVTHGRQRSLFRESMRRKTGKAIDSPFDEDVALEEIELAVSERGRSPRRARLSVSAQAHQVWVRKKTRWWYSAFAGFIAGAIAIMFEKRNRRVGIAQQMFVRYVAHTSRC